METQELLQEMNGKAVPASGDTSKYGAILPVTDEDMVHRLSTREYSISKAAPWHRQHLIRLFDLYREWNERYFGGRLRETYIFLSEPKAPIVYGDFCLVSGFGGKGQFRLRPSLLTGTHPHMRPEDEFAEGRFLFVAWVLLHEMVHQFQLEVIGEAEEAFHGHGPAFRDICNRIGADLGLPPVRSAKKRGPDKDLPSCAQWPHNVTPLDYFLGAYVPPQEKPADPIAEAEAALIQAAVLFGDTNADEPGSDEERDHGVRVLHQARVLRDVMRGVPPSGDSINLSCFVPPPPPEVDALLLAAMQYGVPGLSRKESTRAIAVLIGAAQGYAELERSVPSSGDTESEEG